MLISKKLNDAINTQIGAEFRASMEYIQVAAFYDGEGYVKLAKLFYEQAEEEKDHAMKFIKYVVDAGGSVQIPAIGAPKTTFASFIEPIQLSLDWEVEVTKKIYALYDIARSENDYAAQNLLDWFAEEQIEEFNKMDSLLKVAKQVGDKNIMLVELSLGHEN